MKKIISSLIIATTIFFFPVFNTYADWKDDEACKLNPEAAMCQTQQTAPNLAIILINVVIGVLGVAAVAFIIVSGYRYTTAQGNPDQVAKARQGIVFSVIGLIVAILAFAIVNFVSSSIFS